MDEQKYDEKFIKMMRSRVQDEVNFLNQTASDNKYRSRELSLAITKLEEGRMWLGKELGNLGVEDLNAEREKSLF